MDAIVIAGLSKAEGVEFSVKEDYLLRRDGVPMSWANLLRTFGLAGEGAEPEHQTPYLAGFHLQSYLVRRGVGCGLVRFLDLEEERFRRLLQEGPRVVAVSTTYLVNVQEVRKVVAMVRRHAPEALVVLGGPLIFNSFLLYQRLGTDYDTASCRSDYFFLDEDPEKYAGIDAFVVEEQGEATLFRLIQALRQGERLEEVPNLALFKDGRLLFTPRVPEQVDLAEDAVDWAQVEPEHISPTMPVRGSRGCPYRCRFCNFCTGRTFQLKEPEVLARELEALARTRRVQMIRFTDDNLFLSGRDLERYCRVIARAGAGMRWSSLLRSSSVTRENVELLSDSGCVLAQIGMESGDPGLLRAMRKADRPESYLRAIELLNTHGISTRLYFIIGFPGETEATIERTVRLINRFEHRGPAVNTLMVFPFVLLPLSPIYEPEARRAHSLRGYMTDWSHATMTSEQARRHSRELLARLEHIHPSYGVDELLRLESSDLKQVYELRSRIRRAELDHSPAPAMDRLWRDLREEVGRIARRAQPGLVPCTSSRML